MRHATYQASVSETRKAVKQHFSTAIYRTRGDTGLGRRVLCEDGKRERGHECEALRPDHVDCERREGKKKRTEKRKEMCGGEREKTGRGREEGGPIRQVSVRSWSGTLMPGRDSEASLCKKKGK